MCVCTYAFPLKKNEFSSRGLALITLNYYISISRYRDPQIQETENWVISDISFPNKICSLGYERVYLPLHKVANTLFHIQGDEISRIKTYFIFNTWLNRTNRYT